MIDTGIFEGANRELAELAAEEQDIDHPAHYTQGSLEVIDAIEGMELGYHAGNVVKYIARYKLKGGVKDLKKARWYLDRLIRNEEQYGTETRSALPPAAAKV